MSRKYYFALAIITILVGGGAIVLGAHNALVRAVGVTFLFFSLFLIRAAQKRVVPGLDVSRSKIRLTTRIALLIAFLVIATASLWLATRLFGIDFWSKNLSHLLLVAIGFVAALVGGLVNYLGTRRGRNIPNK